MDGLRFFSAKGKIGAIRELNDGRTRCCCERAGVFACHHFRLQPLHRSARSSSGASRRVCTGTWSSVFGRGRSTLYTSLSRGAISSFAGACDFSRSTWANFIEHGTRTGARLSLDPVPIKLLERSSFSSRGSACGPVIVPVFKTGERQAILSLVGSTPTRFRHFKFSGLALFGCSPLPVALPAPENDLRTKQPFRTAA